MSEAAATKDKSMFKLALALHDFNLAIATDDPGDTRAIAGARLLLATASLQADKGSVRGSLDAVATQLGNRLDARLGKDHQVLDLSSSPILSKFNLRIRESSKTDSLKAIIDMQIACCVGGERLYRAKGKLIDKWVTEYSNGAFQTQLRTDMGQLLETGNPRNPQQELLAEIIASRLPSWQLLSKELGMPMPQEMTLRRGVKGPSLVQQTLAGWKTGRPIDMAAVTLCSASMNKGMADWFAGHIWNQGNILTVPDGVSYEFNVPTQHVLLDKFLDGGIWLTKKYQNMDEAIVMSGADNTLVCQHDHARIRYGNVWHSSDQADHLIEIMKLSGVLPKDWRPN